MSVGLLELGIVGICLLVLILGSIGTVLGVKFVRDQNYGEDRGQ